MASGAVLALVMAVGMASGILPSFIKNFIISVFDSVLMRNSVANFGGNPYPHLYRLFFFTLAKKFVFEHTLTSMLIGRGISFIFIHEIYEFIPVFNSVIRLNTIDNHFLVKLIDVGLLGLLVELVVLLKMVHLCIRKIRRSINREFYAFILFLTSTYYTCLFTVAELGTMKFFWIIIGMVLFMNYMDEKAVKKPDRQHTGMVVGGGQGG